MSNDKSLIELGLNLSAFVAGERSSKRVADEMLGAFGNPTLCEAERQTLASAARDEWELPVRHLLEDWLNPIREDGGQLRISKVYGRYDGQWEPSLSCEMTVAARHLPLIHQVAREFRERFRQKEVHCIEAVSCGRDDGVRPTPRSGGTRQTCWIGEFVGYMSPRLIEEEAGKYGVPAYTLDLHTNRILIYTIESPIRDVLPELSDKEASFVENLKSIGWVKPERRCEVLLTRFVG
jgi:hypothetical protein